MMRAWTFALIATAVLCAIVPLDGPAYAAAPRPLGWGVRYVTQAYDDEDMAAAADLREHWVRITVATQEASPCQQVACNLYIRLEQLQVVVQVEPVDLNHDGTPELLLRSSLCQATGCPYALVMRRSGTWRDMLNPIVAQNIVVNTELSGPLKSLSVTSQRAGYDVIDFTTYVWGGVSYVPDTGGSRGQATPFGPPAGAERFGAPGGASVPISPFGPPGGTRGNDGPFGSPSGGLPAPKLAYQTRYAITPKAATMGESDGTFVFQLTRVGDLPAETVYVSTVIGAKSGFAVNANDYKGKKNEPVKFGEGVPSQPVTLVLYPETLDDGDKTFGLLVERAPGAANNAVLATEKFTIRDDDEAAPIVGPTTGFGFPLGLLREDTAPLGWVPTTSPTDKDGYYSSQGLGQEYGYVCMRDSEAKYHLGEDWNRDDEADFGKKVYAIADGIVVSSELSQSTWLNVIIIKTLLPESPEYGGYVTVLYGHLGERFVKKGDRVIRGAPIGTIGDPPGLSPHLHLEIRTPRPNTGTIELEDSDRWCGYHRNGKTSKFGQLTPSFGWLVPSEFIKKNAYSATRIPQE
jgi:murein DD-endopeptidase MepM/ murein hydrolase activator NlpD